MTIHIYTKEDLQLITPEHQILCICPKYRHGIWRRINIQTQKQPYFNSNTCCYYYRDIDVDNLFNHNKIPSSITTIHCSLGYTETINDLLLPDNLQTLVLHYIDKPLNNLPSSIKSLSIIDEEKNREMIQKSKIPIDCEVFFNNNMKYHY